jgi:hypothetical protein
MIENSFQDFDDVLPEEPNGELVHWMEPRPMTFGTGGLSIAVAAAFALGLAAALLAVGVSRMAAQERRMSLPLQRKLRQLH